MSTSVARPKQKRSEKSLESMLAAARQLIAEDSFESASVSRIAKDAGLSVGAFYSRFRDKEALFYTIQSQTLDELQQTTLTRVARYAARQKTDPNKGSLEKVATFAVDTLIRLYSESPGLIRAIFMHTRMKRDPELLGRVKTFNTVCVSSSLILLENITNEYDNKHVKEAWISAIAVVGSFLREQLLFGDPMPVKGAATKLPHRKIAIKILVAYMADVLGNHK